MASLSRHLGIGLAIVAAVAYSGCEQVPDTHPSADAGDSLPQGAFQFPTTSSNYDTPPYFLKGDAPIYPWKYRMATKMVTGYAVLSYTINEAGRAVKPHLVEASHTQFAAGVAEVMPSWRFRPAMKDGVPVTTTVTGRWEFGESMGHWRPKDENSKTKP